MLYPAPARDIPTCMKMPLTISGTFKHHVTIFYIIVALAFSSALALPKLVLVKSLVQNVFVATDALPSLVILLTVVVWVSLKLLVMAGLAFFRTGGYDNNHPKEMTSSMATDVSQKWLYRLECAHNNTMEALVYFGCANVVASRLNLNQLLWAEWSFIFLAARLAYPVAYAADIDILRTYLFGIGLWSSCLMMLFSIFPALSPLLA